MKPNKLIYIPLFFLLLLNIQCLDDDEISSLPTNCNDIARIDSFSYENAATDSYTINSAVLNEDCLIINISASGCSGNSWVMQLMDSGEVDESLPPQRSLKLFLINSEACLSVVNRQRSFDVSTLQIDDTDEIVLNIDGFSETIMYAY